MRHVQKRDASLVGNDRCSGGRTDARHRLRCCRVRTDARRRCAPRLPALVPAGAGAPLVGLVPGAALPTCCAFAGVFDLASLVLSRAFALPVCASWPSPALPAFFSASVLCAMSFFALPFSRGEPFCFFCAPFEAGPFDFCCAFALGCAGCVTMPGRAPPPPGGRAGAILPLPRWASASPTQNAKVATSRQTTVSIDTFIAILPSI